METKNKVATVRKEGVSDSGKPTEAINEAKGMDSSEYRESDFDLEHGNFLKSLGLNPDKVKNEFIRLMNTVDGRNKVEFIGSEKINLHFCK